MSDVKDLMDVFDFELDEAMNISNWFRCLGIMVEKDEKLTNSLEKTQIRLENLENLLIMVKYNV